MADPVPSKGSTSQRQHPRKCEHFVKFYEAEDHLYDSISRFVLPSFFSLENAAIIVATQSHLQALEHHLMNQNLMPDLLKERRQLKLLNAHDVLKRLMPGGKLEPQEFESYFRPLFRDVQKTFTKVLAYGELVNILCEQGQHETAHELEKVWDHFLAGQNVSLLCGYDMNVFRSNGLDNIFQKICRSHSHVEPSEDGYLDLHNPQDHAIAIAMLQQKAKCLEDEIGRRKAAESSLQATLENLSLTTSDTVPIRELERYRTRFSTLPFGICIAAIFDGTLKYFVNTRFSEMTGMSAGKIQREEGWINAVHPHDRERVAQMFTFRGDASTARNHKYRLVTGPRTLRWVYGEMMGNRLGYVHTIEDIQDPTKVDYSGANVAVSVTAVDSFPYRPPHGAGGANDLRNLNPNSLTSDIYGSSLTPGFWHSPMRFNQAGVHSRGSSEIISNEPSPREPTHQLQAQFSKMASILAGIMKGDMCNPTARNSADLESIQKQLDTVQASYEDLQEFLAVKKISFDNVNDKLTVQVGHAAYLGSMVILTRPVLVRLATESLQTKFTVNEQSLEGTFTNRCISSARELCKVIAALLKDLNPNPSIRNWLLTHFSVTALLVIFLDMALRRGRGDSAIQDEIAEIVTKCFGNLVQSPEQDPVSKQYVEMLNPFLISLNPQPPSTSEVRPLPVFVHDPHVLDFAWTKLWSSYPTNQVATSILNILEKPCGGMCYEEWAAQSWDWKFLLPRDGSRSPDVHAEVGLTSGWSSGVSSSTIYGARAELHGRRNKRSRTEAETESVNSRTSSVTTTPTTANQSSLTAVPRPSRRELEALFRRVT